MRFSEIKERAATETMWQWHHPKALDSLKDYCISKDLWRLQGDYIEKGPFPKEPTSVSFKKLNCNEETGQVTLRLIPKCGDKVHYGIGEPATKNSPKVDDLNNFRFFAISCG